MASDKEIDRMVDNIEDAINRIRASINRLPAIFNQKTGDLSDLFLELRNGQSRLIEIQSKLQMQKAERYAMEVNQRKGN